MFNKKRNKLLFSGTILMTALALTGCGSASNNNNELVVAQRTDAVSLDPHATNDSNSALVMAQIYDRLIYQDENMELHPGLAESWTQIDDLTYEFNLKKNVYFHNGEELTATDVEFTLLRALDSAYVAHIVGQINGDAIEIMDDYTIRISTYEPFAPFLAHLAHTASSILNEKAVIEAGEDYGQLNQAIGTGPYVLEDWSIGDRVLLSRNDSYHGDVAKIENLVIKAINEDSSRSVELETKEVDIALDISPADVNRIEESSDLTLLREADLRTSYLGFNLQKEPFDDVRVRQAINYAIDTDLIVQTVLEGVGAPTVGPIGSNVWGANPNLEAYPVDLEKAQALLSEAGFEDGFSTTIWTDSDGTRVSIATIIRNTLESLGIDASIQQLEWSAYLEQTAEGNHDMFLLGWSSVTGDADYGLYSLFHSNEFGAAGNRTFYKNERIDELLDLGRATIDEGTRRAYYNEVQEIIVEDAPWVPINVGETTIGTQNNVKGFVINPNSQYNFSNVYFE